MENAYGSLAQAPVPESPARGVDSEETSAYRRLTGEYADAGGEKVYVRWVEERYERRAPNWIGDIWA